MFDTTAISLVNDMTFDTQKLRATCPWAVLLEGVVLEQWCAYLEVVQS